MCKKPVDRATFDQQLAAADACDTRGKTSLK